MSNQKASSKPNKGITLIRKSNELIEARYKFDIWETRFFLSVLSKIRLEDDDFKVYRIRYQEIAREFGLKTHQSYDMLREGAKKLMTKNFHVKYEENGKPRETLYHILRKIDYSIQGKKENREYNFCNCRDSISVTFFTSAKVSRINHPFHFLSSVFVASLPVLRVFVVGVGISTSKPFAT